MTPLGTPAYLPGIDVSHFQGLIDWQKVKAAGIGCAFIKATDGTSFVDPQFKANAEGCSQAGIPFGFYHFFRPTLDARQQAAHFLDTVTPVLTAGTHLPPCLDLEVGPLQVAQATAWLDQVDEALSREPLIYTSPAFAAEWLTTGGLGIYPLWLAQYTSKPQPDVPEAWSDWEFWQHTQNGSVDGVPNQVDLNWFHGTAEDLQMWIR